MKGLTSSITDDAEVGAAVHWRRIAVVASRHHLALERRFIQQLLNSRYEFELIEIVLRVAFRTRQARRGFLLLAEVFPHHDTDGDLARQRNEPTPPGLV